MAQIPCRTLLPPFAEIVPLLSGFLARCSIGPLGGLSPPSGLDDPEILGQDRPPRLDAHTLPAATAEATPTPVRRGIREPQRDRPAPLPVKRLRLGWRQRRLRGDDQVLRLLPLARPNGGSPRAPAGPGAARPVLLRATVERDLHRTTLGTSPHLLAAPLQALASGTGGGRFPGRPAEFALGDLMRRSLPAARLRPVVLLRGGRQVRARLGTIDRVQGRGRGRIG